MSASSSRRRAISVEVDGTIFVLRGWQAHKLALDAGLRPTYSGVRQGWVADTKKLSTLEAYCAHRQVALEVEGLQHPDVQHEQHPDVQQTPSADVPLFDLGGR